MSTIVLCAGCGCRMRIAHEAAMSCPNCYEPACDDCFNDTDENCRACKLGPEEE